MRRLRSWIVPLVVAGISSGLTWLLTQRAVDSPVQAADAGPGWVKGKGYGWVWGPKDELGALNTSTEATRAAALKLAKRCVDTGIEQDPRGALATEILAIEENLARHGLGLVRDIVRAPRGVAFHRQL